MQKYSPHVFPKYIIHGFFIIGLLSAIAFRAIIIFERLEPGWVDINYAIIFLLSVLAIVADLILGALK